MLLEDGPDDGILPEQDNVVLACGENGRRIVLDGWIGRTWPRRALHRRDKRRILRRRGNGLESARVCGESGEDALPAAACPHADVFVRGGCVWEELLHEFFFDREKGGEAHADPTVVVGERGGGETDTGGIGRATCDTFSFGDGRGGCCLERGLPFLLEDF